MVRSIPSSEKDGMIYRRSDLERRQEGLVGNLDGIVRAAPAKAKEKPSGARRLNWSRQQTRPGSMTWALVVERVTRIKIAL